MPKTKDAALTINLTESPQAAQGQSLLAQVGTLAIVDKQSHEACREFIKGAKTLKREVEAHYEAIKKPLNAARATVLDMEKKHLAPIDAAIAIAVKLDTTWTVAEQQRQQAEADRQRIENEKAAREQREKELAAQEAAAQAAEASSPDLSAREALFVKEFTGYSDRGPAGLLRAARLAGYKDVHAQALRLFKLPKISAAIDAADKAAAIRKQAEAVKTQPLSVAASVVESQLGSVPGTSMRTTYGAEIVNLGLFVKAYREMEIDSHAMMPDQVWLNAQARNNPAMFERLFAGCRLVVNRTVAG